MLWFLIEENEEKSKCITTTEVNSKCASQIRRGILYSRHIIPSIKEVFIFSWRMKCQLKYTSTTEVKSKCAAQKRWVDDGKSRTVVNHHLRQDWSALSNRVEVTKQAIGYHNQRRQSTVIFRRWRMTQPNITTSIQEVSHLFSELLGVSLLVESHLINDREVLAWAWFNPMQWECERQMMMELKRCNSWHGELLPQYSYQILMYAYFREPLYMNTSFFTKTGIAYI